MFSLPSMFHVPFRFRSQTTYCVPKGPNYEDAKAISFEVDGSKIELRAPRHRAASFEVNRSPKVRYDLDKRIMRGLQSGDEKWCGFSPVYKAWDFYGPWFTGAQGHLTLSMSIVAQQDSRNEGSIFHPKFLENHIAEFLTHTYKEAEMEVAGRQRWVAPINWTSKSNFPCLAASFDVVGGVQDRGDFERLLVFPVSNAFLCITRLAVGRPLPFVSSSTLPEDNVEDWISDQPMIDLADQILGSVKLTLSPEAETQQAKALEGLDNPHLSESFAPLNWGPEGGSEINDRLLAEFIQQHEAKKQKKLTE